MKHLKRFMALIIALCLGILSTATVFAAEDYSVSTGSNIAESEVDYLNYDFPDDAKIIYQGEDGVMYQTHEGASVASTQSTRSTEYNGVWIDAGKTKIGSFTVPNPHRLGGNGEGRLRLESNDPNVKMSVTVSNGGTSLYLGTTTIGVGNDVVFDFNSISSKLVVHYSVVKYSYTNGMRLNCWLS